MSDFKSGFALLVLRCLAGFGKATVVSDWVLAFVALVKLKGAACMPTILFLINPMR